MPIAAGTLVGLALVSLVVLRLPYLMVTGAGGRPLFHFLLWPKGHFTLTYRHSVQKTLCYENIELGRAGDLVLTSTEYESLGVGLPFLVGDGRLVNQNGRFILTGLDRHFPSLELRAMPVARQALLVHGRRYDFNTFFAPGELIRLRVVFLSPLEAWNQKLTLGED